MIVTLAHPDLGVWIVTVEGPYDHAADQALAALVAATEVVDISD